MLGKWKCRTRSFHFIWCLNILCSRWVSVSYSLVLFFHTYFPWTHNFQKNMIESSTEIHRTETSNSSWDITLSVGSYFLLSFTADSICSLWKITTHFKCNTCRKWLWIANCSWLSLLSYAAALLHLHRCGWQEKQHKLNMANNLQVSVIARWLLFTPLGN